MAQFLSQVSLKKRDLVSRAFLFHLRLNKKIITKWYSKYSTLYNSTLTLHHGAHKTLLKQTSVSLNIIDLLEVEPHIQVLSNISSGSKTYGTTHYIIPLRLVPVSPYLLSGPPKSFILAFHFSPSANEHIRKKTIHTLRLMQVLMRTVKLKIKSCSINYFSTENTEQQFLSLERFLKKEITSLQQMTKLYLTLTWLDKFNFCFILRWQCFIRNNRKRQPCSVSSTAKYCEYLVVICSASMYEVFKEDSTVEYIMSQRL